MKQIPKKITIRNINGLKLYVLNVHTADIITGTFVQAFLNNEPDDMRKKFITDDGRELFFGVEEKFLKRIDIIHKHLKSYKSGYYDFSDECEQGCSDDFSDSDWYLIFTSLDKAKKVSKAIVIPDLMKDKTKAIDKHMGDYMTAVSELEALEDKLK